MSNSQHWEKVFTSKNENEVSWYEKSPLNSIKNLEELNISKDEAIIDVGCGDSYFIDYLVDHGYKNIYALDISETALNKLKQRLGEKAENIHWIVSDVLEYSPDTKFSFWHDRASFHFQTDDTSINKYIELTNSNINEGGYLYIGTFSENGPQKCSGLNVNKYSQDELAHKFEGHFKKIKCVNETHVTPFETTQEFTLCSFQKLAE